MNKYIKDINVNVNAEANSETVRIRMSDFYSDYVGEQEFCEVSAKVYEELLHFKAIEEVASTDESDSDDEADCSIRIRIADFYPDNCCKDEYCDVSIEVYEQLCRERVKEQSSRRDDRRHIASFDFDEDKLGDMYGIYSKSAEEACYENDMSRKLEAAIKKVNPVLFNRFYRHHVLGIRTSHIAHEDGISHTGVKKSCERVREQLRKYITEQ